MLSPAIVESIGVIQDMVLAMCGTQLTILLITITILKTTNLAPYHQHRRIIKVSVQLGSILGILVGYLILKSGFGM